jgi:hypothetical protein
VEVLEEKVEGLLARLAAQNACPTDPNANVTVNLSTPAATETAVTPPVQTSIFPEDGRSHSSAIAPVPSLDNGDADPDIVGRGLLTMTEADILLQNFKRLKTPHFPFVIIPPEIDATALRQRCPFLFLAVMAACLEENPALQKHLGVEIKKAICKRIILDDEKNIELLQGLLVHCSWYHYHLQPANRQLHLFLKMALWIITEMGLDRRPLNENSRHGGIDVDARKSERQKGLYQDKKSRLAAEKRALLGCYYICSVSVPLDSPQSACGIPSAVP